VSATPSDPAPEQSVTLSDQTAVNSPVKKNIRRIVGLALVLALPVWCGDELGAEGDEVT
jgi:hypothetical protein